MVNNRNEERKNERNNKNNKNTPILWTEEERKKEVRIIINKLNELQLTITYEPIKQLFVILQEYIKKGTKVQINIPFPMINKRIKGLLSETINEKCWIKLEHENF